LLLDSDINSIHVTINQGLLTAANTLSTDINGDGKVDIIDIAVVARGFGSTSGKPNWNPIADVNGNDVINIIDIATVAKEFKV
jgi:hypothetical protein